jgi:hypothetical protein
VTQSLKLARSDSLAGTLHLQWLCAPEHSNGRAASRPLRPADRKNAGRDAQVSRLQLQPIAHEGSVRQPMLQAAHDQAQPSSG